MYLINAQISYRSTWTHNVVVLGGAFDMSKSLCIADSF